MYWCFFFSLHFKAHTFYIFSHLQDEHSDNQLSISANLLLTTPIHETRHSLMAVILQRTSQWCQRPAQTKHRINICGGKKKQYSRSLGKEWKRNRNYHTTRQSSQALTDIHL